MRCPDEKARFRGNDALYRDNWEHIFGNKGKSNEETETTSTITDTSTGADSRHASEDVAGLRSDDADERAELPREDAVSGGLP